MDQRIVIIGGGQAGAALAAKLRALGHKGAMTLICEESTLPYQRPPLSKKYLLGQMDEARLHLRPAEFYAEEDIALIIGVAATAIDREARFVNLSDGRKIPYDQLALTTGTRPRRLPASICGELGGVYPVRTRRHVDIVAPEFRTGARVLIVGGGYIGLEAAAVATLRGLDVTLIELADRILQRVAAPVTSDYFRDLHRGHGVDIRESVGLTRLEGEERVERAVLTNGETVDIDFVLVGVGVAPNQEIAAEAGLETENGVKVDEAGRTSDPLIFAAGDCASFPYEGRLIRLESVQNAIDQAEVAAAAMLGESVSYTPTPWFWSDQYDVKLQIAGLNQGYDHVHVRPGAAGAQSVWYYRAGRLISVDAMNDPRAYMVGKRLIEAGKSPAPEAVADPATDLKTLLKAPA
ncbi:FAD-dependent oxidoreductase [Pikeienuella piscinae]|uniref:FAD-dependent oxidoreductase n=1 Tax=Pikeienuella piscinae TaxID=2748098 RepID=A0A7L5BXL5_9RHOB|nr:FAD-dependent oxidoreductase [Pikeienuella piscinae]QIE55883.1 FAD-dependent oxidoreductase [Pikeienuella piscinae]